MVAFVDLVGDQLETLFLKEILPRPDCHHESAKKREITFAIAPEETFIPRVNVSLVYG